MRWKAPEGATQNNGSFNSQQAFSASSGTAQASNHFASYSSPAASGSTSPANGNPLRNRVQMAAFQQDPANAFQDPFGDAKSPALPPAGLPPAANSGENAFPGLPGFPVQPTQPAPELVPPGLPTDPSDDPLARPEAAPAPGDGLEFEQAPRLRGESPSPRDQIAPRENEPEAIPVPEDVEEAREMQLPKRRVPDANSAACNELREQLRSRPVPEISLNVSPKYQEGMRTLNRDETERAKRLGEFAENSEIRDWTDYTGKYLATGRLIDFKNNQIVLDVQGATRTIPYLDLSDLDVSYVAQVWDIPTVCGTGYERLVGRSFVPSELHWTASGLCHKPLYFEDVQLERYGHEIGPILQPFASTAHFFGNALILPYKMGIHPPNECQYSLGYIRPGNCAPYMIQPFPWSLRGAATQAAVVAGGAALIP